MFRKSILILIIIVITLALILIFYSNEKIKFINKNYNNSVFVSLNISKNISREKLKLDTRFFINNRKNLISKIKDNSAVILFSDPILENINYTPNRNFYYYTGVDKENFIFIMIKSKGKSYEYLFGKEGGGINRWTGYTMGTQEAEVISGVSGGYDLGLFKEYYNKLIKSNDIKNIYLDIPKNLSAFDSDGVNILRFKSPSEVFAQDLLKEDNNILEIGNISGGLREIKSDEEIANIKRAIEITNEGIKSMMKNAKPGMNEYELKSYFDFTTKTLGSREYSFLPIIASGKNSTILHYQDNNSLLNSKELILVDVGASYGYYSADITRTFPVDGKFTDRQKEIYNGLLKAQNEIIKSIKPGISFSELEEYSRKVLAREAIKLGLISESKDLRNIYMHSITHSIGLDTHDPMVSANLKPGMVITVEPGFYIDSENIGIRIEDDILVTENGYKNLSENIIKTIEDIEEFMRKE